MTNDAGKEIIEAPTWQTEIARAGRAYPRMRASKDLVFAQERAFALSIVEKSEGLRKCAPISIYEALLQAGSMGLSLNPTLSHCYLIPRWSKVAKAHIAYASPGYRGLIHLAESGGGILRIAAIELVHKNDVFEWLGPTTMPRHKVDQFGGKRGEIVGAWLAIKFSDGEIRISTIDKAQFEACRKRSEAPKSLMYTDFPGEAYKKCLIRRDWKTWPKTIHQGAMYHAIEQMNEHEDLALPAPEEAIVVLSEAQVNELHAMVTDAGIGSDKADSWLQRLGRTFGVIRIIDLPADKLDEAKAKLKEHLGARA